MNLENAKKIATENGMDLGIDAKKVLADVNNNSGFCPCLIVKCEASKCPCIGMRRAKRCICGLFV